MSDAHLALHELHDVSVLFPTLEETRAAWKAVFGSDQPSAVLSRANLNGLAMLVDHAMNPEAVDLRMVEREAGSFSMGEGYIGLRLGIAAQFDLRQMTQSYPDPWAPGGRMREASLLVSALLARGGHAVVLHKAAAAVKSAATFQYELGESFSGAPRAAALDPDARPWLAWLDVLVSSEADGLEARTYGMPHYFGAPNVKAFAPNTDAWSLEALAQAVKFASGRVAAANDDAMQPPAHLAVPLWYTAGRRKPEVPKGAPVRLWKARMNPENATLLELTSEEVTTRHPAHLWEAARTDPAAMPFETYARALADILTHRLSRWNLRRVDEPRYDAPGLPPVRVISYSNRTLEMHVTAGFGAVRAPSGTDELGTAHAELAMLAPPGDTAMVENALLGFGSLALQTTAPGGLKDFDHLAASANGWGYLIVPLEDIALSATRPVALRMLVPVTRVEIEALKQGANRKAFYEEACPDLDAVALRWTRMREA